MSGHFSLTIGSETVSIDGIEGGSISVHNRFTVLPPDAPVGMELGVDKFRIVFGRGYPGQEYGFFGGRKVYGLEISLSDASGNVFPDTELPGGEMRLDQFTSAGLRVKFQESVGGWYHTTPGTITSLVPEPSALSLLAVGLGGLAMMRRRRS